ncbi:MAG: hypothetical protein M3Z05_15275, partial [Gemmatimonadota bacterium]|nr:hypothetical protein [Gemmatimonadota bacterium]
MAFAVRASLLLLLSAAACVDGRLTAPASQMPAPARAGGDPSVTAAARAAVEQQIAAINYLRSERGFEQMLRHGVDPALVASRRRQAEADLVDLTARLDQIEKGDVGGRSSITDPNDLPQCFFNADLDISDCILSAYMTIDHGGSGTVTTSASWAVSHSTSTVIEDGSAYLGTKPTSNFFLQPYYYNTFSFPPVDCGAADHDVVGKTNHHIAFSVNQVGLSGDKPSTDHSVCFLQYLTVALSANSITVGSTVNVSVGHLGSNPCNFSVNSSNRAVAIVVDAGGGIWGATGVGAGTATISAACLGGATGSATLTVVSAPPPP